MLFPVASLACGRAWLNPPACSHMPLWNARVHATPREGNPHFAGPKGLVLHAVGRAVSSIAFRLQVERAVRTHGLDVAVLEDPAEFRPETASSPAEERLAALARQADETGNVEFDVLYPASD